MINEQDIHPALLWTDDLPDEILIPEVHPAFIVKDRSNTGGKLFALLVATQLIAFLNWFI